MDPENKIDHLRVASFSSYIRSGEERSPPMPAELTQSSSVTFISSSQTTPRPMGFARRKMRDGEIDVFGAEKYYNKIMSDQNLRAEEKDVSRKEDRANVDHTKPKVQLGTPSESSEVSLNSQIALLPSILRNPSRSKQRKVSAKRFFKGFGCNGSCINKNYMNVDDSKDSGVPHQKELRSEASQLPSIPQAESNPSTSDGTKQDEFQFPSLGLNKEGCFAFPKLCSVPENTSIRKHPEEKRGYGYASKSPEAFNSFDSHLVKKGDILKNMLSWDPIPQVQNPSLNTRSSVTNEDNESDASSDLFEIENLSGNGQPFFIREEGMLSYESPTRYEPSEGSIEWSVITASAADFSAVSDYNEGKPSSSKGTEIRESASASAPTKAKSVLGNEAQRNHHSGLLGCRSWKAVRVAENAYRANVMPRFNSHHPSSMNSSPERNLQQETMGKNIRIPCPRYTFASRDPMQY